MQQGPLTLIEIFRPSESRSYCPSCDKCIQPHLGWCLMCEVWCAKHPTWCTIQLPSSVRLEPFFLTLPREFKHRKSLDGILDEFWVCSLSFFMFNLTDPVFPIGPPEDMTLFSCWNLKHGLHWSLFHFHWLGFHTNRTYPPTSMRPRSTWFIFWFNPSACFIDLPFHIDWHCFRAVR
jgi:hypothetical protein